MWEIKLCKLLDDIKGESVCDFGQKGLLTCDSRSTVPKRKSC